MEMTRDDHVHHDDLNGLPVVRSPAARYGSGVGAAAAYS
jgi:hypothetical protein